MAEVISTVALADQISREFNVSDQGIDMEIVFTDDAQEATGRKLYLQLKSGDSYLRERKSDGAEILTIKDERHARYWMAQAFPVLLVIRNAEGEVRWMEVRDWLKRASDNGRKPVKQIIFAGERFDVMSVRRWREKILGVGCGVMKALERTTLNPAVMAGRPCIRGLRVTVGMVVGLVAAGHTPAEILKPYPYLEADDIPAALAYAAWRAEEQELAKDSRERPAAICGRA